LQQLDLQLWCRRLYSVRFVMTDGERMTSKTAMFLLALVLGVARAVAADGTAAPSGQERAEAAGKGLIGSPAPRVVLTTIDGQKIDLGSLYGKKAVYLKFWATWCVPCREQMPHFERTYEAAGPDLAVIAINAGFNDSLADVQTYRTRMGIKMPIVIDDGKLAEAFNLRVTPQHVIIGRDGRIQYVGHLANERLDAALLEARTTGPTAAQAAGSAAISDRHGYDVGDRLPHLSVTTLDGKQFAIGMAPPRHGTRQRTVLVFLSPWCESYLATSRPGLAADCKEVREKVDALAAKSQSRWIGIASGLWASPVELAAYRDGYKVSIDLTLDDSGSLFRQFRVMSVPTVLVADESGKIVRRLEGHAAAGL
jgi:thiol-disulfide isomerase/thioredoxin